MDTGLDSLKTSPKKVVHKAGEFIGNTITARKFSKYGVFSGPYFPVVRLNMEIYSINFRIQAEYRKVRTRKNFVLDTFQIMHDNIEKQEPVEKIIILPEKRD